MHHLDADTDRLLAREHQARLAQAWQPASNDRADLDSTAGESQRHWLRRLRLELHSASQVSWRLRAFRRSPSGQP